MRTKFRRRPQLERLDQRRLLANDLAAISGIAFVDSDSSGTQNGAEAALEGVEVELYRDADNDGILGSFDNLIGTAVTGADGRYRFNNLDGNDLDGDPLTDSNKTNTGQYILRFLDAAGDPDLSGVTLPGEQLVTIIDDAGLTQVVIDDFTASQPSLLLTSPGIVTSSTGDVSPVSGVLGGERDLELFVQSNANGPPFQAEAFISFSPDVALTFANDAVTQSALIVQYDGLDADAGSLNFNTTGLRGGGASGVDLSGGDSEAGLQLLIASDQAVSGGLIVRMHTDDLLASFTFVDIPDTLGLPQEVFIPFNSFMSSGMFIGPADFTNIGGIEVEFDSLSLGGLDLAMLALETLASNETIVDVPAEPVSLTTTIDVTKSANVSTVNAGESLTYTIDVSNTGSSNDATSLVALDTLPAGVSFVSATIGSGVGTIDPTNGGANDGVIRFDLPSLSPLSTESIVINVLVDPDFDLIPSQLINTVDVSADNATSVSASLATTVTRLTDVAVSKTVVQSRIPDVLGGGPAGDLILTQPPLRFVAGGFATFSIFASNEGPSVARAVTVSDSLPPGLSLVGGSFDPGTSGATISVTGQLLTIDFGDMSPAASVEVTFEVAIAADAAGSGSVVNTATIATIDPDPVPTNNSDSVLLAIERQLDLTLTKSANVASATEGDSIVYTIVVGHDVDSLSDAGAVTVIDPLPIQLTDLQVSAPGSTSSNFDPNTQNATVTFASIPIGQTRTITISGIVATGAAGVLTNKADLFVSADDDFDLTNDTDSIDITIIPSQPVLVGHVFCDADGDGSESSTEAIVGGTVFIDANGNGQLDASEIRTTTDSFGNYEFFSLPPGANQVTLIVPSDCVGVPEQFTTVFGLPALGQIVRDADAIDVDGDGIDDMVAVSDRSNTLSIVGSASSTVTLSLSDRPQAVDVWREHSASPSTPATIAVAAVGSSGSNSTTGSTRPNVGVVFVIEGGSVQQSLTMGDGPIDVVIDDFDSDGSADIVAAAFRSGDFYLRLSSTGETRLLGRGEAAIHVATGDFDEDGFTDVVLGGYGHNGRGTLEVLFGDGTGEFASSGRVLLPTGLIATAPIELFSHDGSPESFIAPGLAVLSPDGIVTTYAVSRGGIERIDSIELGPGASKIEAGDINEDGELDLVVVREREIDLLLGNGSGSFQKARSSTEAFSPVDVVLGRFDGSGDLDMLVANQSTGSVGGTTELLKLRRDTKSVFLSSSFTATANFNPSTDFSQFDVNGDLRISTVDALQIVNAIESPSGLGGEPVAGSRTAQGEPTISFGLPPRTDVNRDGRTSALDALLLINYLNRADAIAVIEPVVAIPTPTKPFTDRDIDELMASKGELF